MMLETDPQRLGAQFAAALERYLSETLHVPVQLSEYHGTGSLPAFLTRSYAFFEAEIAGRRFVFLGAPEFSATPGDVAKHVRLTQDKLGELVGLATPAMSAHNRSRLIQKSVPFAVPGNQLYLPELAIDLREHFRMSKRSGGASLSPAAQAVLFDHLLGQDDAGGTPTQIAQRLGYSAMSVGRAFDDLAATGLAQVQIRGNSKFLDFAHNERALFDQAKPLLRSPVRSVKHVKGRDPCGFLKHAGESALAFLSDLAAPRLEVFAVASGDWKSVAQRFGLEETVNDAANFLIESWSYDPAGLSSGEAVDPLSLYAQFHNHSDERIIMAAEDIVEQVL